MWKQAVDGAIAGAVGTVALNMTTYLDMAVRSRPSSEVPSKVAARLVEKMGANLGSANGEPQSEAARNRFEGLGAVMGNWVGLEVGATYGMLEGALDQLPLPIAGAMVGAAAMAATDVTSAKLGVTKPETWSTTSWMSDIVPHLVFGLTTVAAYRAITDHR